MLHSRRVEYAHERKIRERNKVIYRFAHWPIWIWVFFLAPGPWTFRLFALGPSRASGFWLLFVVVLTGLAGLAGQLPGVEPRPYILRFCEDKPNPLYRRVCYTFAWNALLNYAVLNLAGLITAGVSRRWVLRQIYDSAYFPVLACILLLGMLGYLPRAGRSTKGEGIERKYFYVAVWAIPVSQTILLVLWKMLPATHPADLLKLTCFLFVLLVTGCSAGFGLLPRTRRILPGELMVAD